MPDKLPQKLSASFMPRELYAHVLLQQGNILEMSQGKL